jgi:hypothetical protein
MEKKNQSTKDFSVRISAVDQVQDMPYVDILPEAEFCGIW